jgi:hypothetical protein
MVQCCGSRALSAPGQAGSELFLATPLNDTTCIPVDSSGACSRVQNERGLRSVLGGAQNLGRTRQHSVSDITISPRGDTDCR